MRVKSSLKPGQKGTRKWCEIYGDRLITVRYRYDEKKSKRYTTVEIIVDEGEWEKVIDKELTKQPINNSDRLGIYVAKYERTVRDKVKAAGGIWRARQQLWELPYGLIKKLGLEERIIDEQSQCTHI
jgi:hypothetical protein